MARLWVIRLKRVLRPPRCSVCGDPSEGGLVCDVCGVKLMEQTRDRAALLKGPSL